jgi:hypothetical protein
MIMAPVGVYLGGVRPYRAALGQVTELTAAEVDVLARERALLDHAAPLMESLVLATDRARLAQHRLVTAANEALAERELTQRLESVAFTHRVLLQDLRSVESVRGEEPPAGLRRVRLEVRGESDMEGVLSFLGQVETSPLLVKVVGMSLQPEMARPPAPPGRGRNSDQERGPPRPTGVVEFVMIVEAYARVESDGGLAAESGIEGGER